MIARISPSIFKTMLLGIVIVGSINADSDFENGKFFIINSVASGKAITVSGSTKSAVVTQPWIARDTQTWLALKETRTKEGRAVGGSPKYVLIPQKQSWDWKDVVTNGEVNLTLETLPPNTLVLSLDTTAVNLTQEIFIPEESTQKWVVEDVGKGEVLIRNWGNQQCVRNFDHKNPNLLENLRKRIDNFFGVFRRRKPSPLGTLACDQEDISERWLLEPTYVLNFRRNG